jgi:hypothetical protein
MTVLRKPAAPFLLLALLPLAAAHPATTLVHEGGSSRPDSAIARSSQASRTRWSSTRRAVES